MIGFAAIQAEAAHGRFGDARGCGSRRVPWQHIFILNEFTSRSVEASLKKPPAFSGV
jgi:hypothetical protein